MQHHKGLYTLAAFTLILTAAASASSGNDQRPVEPTITPSILSVDIDAGGSLTSWQSTSSNASYHSANKNGYAYGFSVGYEPFSHVGFTAGWLKQPGANVTLANLDKSRISAWSGYSALKFDMRLPYTISDRAYIEAGAAYNHQSIKSNNTSFENITPIVIAGIRDQLNSNIYWGLQYMYLPRSISSNHGYRAPNINNIMLTLGTDTSYL